MKISLAWLKDYVDLPEGVAPEEIARKLTFAGFEVEAIHKQAAGLDKVFVGELLEVKQHPNADRLSLTKVNVGNALGTGAILSIVCGAKNIAVGLKIPVATVGAIIPNGLEIKAAKIRGEFSEGMLCSPEELKLEMAQAESGILILDTKAKVGQPFAQHLGLDGVVFEINVTPNRGDALSHVGIAREVAAVFGARWRVPDVELEEVEVPLPLSVRSLVGEDCPAYFARYVEGVKVGESPDWLKKRIESLGLRSVNNVVDATTYVLYEIGQPIHAFDADTLESGRRIEINVRAARAGESFSTISHRELQLDGQDLVIGAGPEGEKAAALAGVMGSDRTEVTERTRNVLIESADFSPIRVRRANRGHALMTDAAYRFERGVDPARIAWAADRAAALIAEVAGGRVSRRIASEGAEAGAHATPPSVRVTDTDIRRVLGVSPGIERARIILETLGFAVKAESGSQGLGVSPPAWRRDIERTEDLVEEIGRIWGYENLVARVPHGMVPFKRSVNELERQVSEVRRLLTNYGFHEALNYSFSSRDAEAAVLGESGAAALVEMQGIQGREFNVMKSSLVPGLARNLAQNLAHGQGAVRLFEIRTCFASSDPARQKGKSAKLETGVTETRNLALALTGPEVDEDWEARGHEADFYSLKGIVETIIAFAGRAGIRFEAKDLPTYLHPGQAAGIFLGNIAFGRLGRLHPRVERRLGLEKPVYVAELELERLLTNEAPSHRFKEFGRFPLVERDFSVTVRDTVDSSTIRALALKATKPLARGLRFFDVYRGERVPSGSISYAFRLVLGSDDHTLTDSEISGAQSAVIQTLTQELEAKFAGLS